MLNEIKKSDFENNYIFGWKELSYVDSQQINKDLKLKGKIQN